ncbi:hypothetical protein ANN_05129, partial [Periplaneta americana]
AISLFEHIEQRFLLSGHSFLQCDSDFALIEKRQKVTKAFIPSDLLKLVQDSKVVKSFQTVSMLDINREITEEKKGDLLAMTPYLPNEEHKQFYRQICE